MLPAASLRGNFSSALGGLFYFQNIFAAFGDHELLAFLLSFIFPFLQ